ncbi:MAG: hypothetical protein ACRDWE_09190 [Acidimicrobiales bacterium]
MADDLTGLDEALRAALGPESPLWAGEGEAGAAARTEVPTGSARVAVVHGVSRRHARRRLSAVTAVTAVVVVVGLSVTQVLAASTPVPKSPSHAVQYAGRAAARPRSAAGGTGSSGATCRPEGGTARPCGVLTAASGSAGARTPAVGPESTGMAAQHATATTSTKSTFASSPSSGDADALVHVAPGRFMAVTLPRGALWTHPSVVASAPQALSGAVLTVRAPPVLGAGAIHGWSRFDVEGDTAGTATIDVTGTCSTASMGASCSNGHTRFVLEVSVGGT